MASNLVLEREKTAVRPRLAEVLAIANSEKDALGFLPHAAYEDALSRKRLYLAREGDEVVGFILFGSAFPHARIQQVGVISTRRREGIGSFLLKSLIEELEDDGFLTIKAKVASNLPLAQSFYRKHGFEAADEVAGGEARNRTIVVRVRHLESRSLLGASGRAFNWSALPKKLTLRGARAGESPFYAIDLNVILDLVQDRARSSDAQLLFGAALAHQVRIAIADEFLRELERSSEDITNDPLLSLAQRLPRLPKVSDASIASIANEIHALVFGRASGGSARRSISDCRHLAHAAAARATGFVTSDGELLAARTELLDKHGIDVTSLVEFVSLLPSDAMSSAASEAVGEGFVCRGLDTSEVDFYLRAVGAEHELISAFCPAVPGARRNYYGVFDNSELVAVGLLIGPDAVAAPAKIFVHIAQHHPGADLFADHLFDVLLARATENGPVAIDLFRLPGQTLVSQVAEGRGFFDADGRHTKVALGRPLTSENWRVAADQVRRLAGIELPDRLDEGNSVPLKDGAGTAHTLALEELEDLLGPTLLISTHRSGVILPIRREFADDLLNTGLQGRLSFVEAKPASFLHRRSYVSSPRNAPFMSVGSPVLFYESTRGHGRAAIIAAARVVDFLVQRKEAVTSADHRRLVVDSVDDFSASDDVLVMSFDQILRLPSPVSLEQLRRIGAVGSMNLRMATPISVENLSAILNAGWSIAR